jgi:hypothetical protein
MISPEVFSPLQRGLPQRGLTDAGVMEMLATLGVNPFVEMAKLAMQDETPVSTRAALWMALAKYCKPQLRAVEIAAPQMELDLEPAVARMRQELGLNG